jgi:hypothetical protein
MKKFWFLFWVMVICGWTICAIIFYEIGGKNAVISSGVMIWPGSIMTAIALKIFFGP